MSTFLAKQQKNLGGQVGERVSTEELLLAAFYKQHKNV